MIKWTGQDTSRTLKWEFKAESYSELADLLIKQDIIGDLYSERGQDYISTWLDIPVNDTVDEDWEQLMDLAYEKMTEEHWADFIKNSNGMAYYQTVELI